MKLFYSIIYCIYICISGVSISGFGQGKGAIFHHLEKKDGLSSSNVQMVIQDREGFYWIATQNGLNRFDGTNVKTFYNNSRDSNSLSHNHCTSLLEDDNGDIWIGTLYGLNCYKKRENRFVRIFLYHPEYVADRLNWIRNLAKDKEGNIWISTFGLWRYKIREKRLDFFFDNPGSSAKAFSGEIYKLIYESRLDGLWGTSSVGYFYFDRKTERFHYNKFNPNKWPVFDFTNSGAIALDNTGKLWLVNMANKELVYFNLVDHRLYKQQYALSISPRNMIADDKNRIWLYYWSKQAEAFDAASKTIDSTLLSRAHYQSPLSPVLSYIFIDNSGNYWFCSTNGISIFDSNEQSKTYISLPKNESGKSTISFLEAKSSSASPDIIWLISRFGVYELNLKTLNFKKVRHAELQQGITGIAPFGDSILFISTDSKLFRYNHILNQVEKTYNGRFTTRSNIIIDTRRKVWLASWSGGLYKFNFDLKLLNHFTQEDGNKDTGLRYNNIINTTSILPGGENFLIGYNNGNGFAEVNTSNDRITNFFMPQSSNAGSMTANTINCFAFDDKKQLWLGTFGGGIYYRDLTGKYHNINQTDGLKSNFINAIIPDIQSDFWISTGEGINVLQDGGKVIINPGDEIALNRNDFRNNCIALPGGDILAFDQTRMVIFHPQKLLSANKPKKILISEFKIFDESFPVTGLKNKLSLKYTQNFFSLEFSLMKTNAAEEVYYAYMLKGFDKSWLFSRNRNGVSYTNVPPGQYEFLIKAAGQDGQWIHFSDPLIIRISPPFWRTTWFYALCIAALVTAIAVLYRYRISQLKKLIALRTKISQDLHDEVGATLSSIHVYSSVATRTLSTDPRKSSEALRHIKDNTRQVMENMSDIVWAIKSNQSGDITLEKKLKNYGYELLAPLNIQCEYQIDTEVDKKLVNMEARKNILLMTKEAMNNIAKYSNATQALIRIELLNKELHLEIRDNGRGFEPEKINTGNGLNNMSHRTRALGGSIIIKSGKNEGTAVLFRIPIANISN